MATALPIPLDSSHFASLSRNQPASRQVYKNAPLFRPGLGGADLLSARKYSLGDSSDDEIPLPMFKCSALTNALLNDVAPTTEPTSARQRKITPELEDMKKYEKGGSVDLVDDRVSPTLSKTHSPFPRRKVRLSRTPGSSTLQRSKSASVADQAHADPADQLDNPINLNTPAPIAKRIVKLPASSGTHRVSAGSSGKYSDKASSAPRQVEGEFGSQEYPTTVARPTLVVSQGSVSRYGQSTVGRTRCAEDAGVKKIAGAFMSVRPRRGRRRISDEEQSPIDNGGVPCSQEPPSQALQQPGPEIRNLESSKEVEANLESFYQSQYRSGSPIGSKDILNSVLMSKPPPPSTSGSSRPESSQQRAPLQSIQPVFKVPAPRPDLPSAHDQENEAPPTFKRNKQEPLIHLDSMEKVSVRPQGNVLHVLHAENPSERPALGPRSQNTPRRPAPPPPKMSILDTATSTAGAAASNPAGKRTRMKVNGKIFTRLDCIGRGGSSRVYRVMAENSKFFALKKVSLEDADDCAVRGFKGEIDLLKKLEGVERVIRLYDYELNEDKGTLTVLMEMGELDMNKILELRLKSDNAKFDPSFVRHYWKEMLECLEAIHEHNVVHSDLKPHNFVLVQGRLKLIDFGIANAIESDETVNVHRENQIGTPNYMSPESLMDFNAKPDSRGRISNGPKLMKLGKPSDIWSLGCILYQMTYGRAPFAHIQNQMQRCQAIINWNYTIEYPSVGVGNVPVPHALVQTLKRCLNRDQFKRPSTTELLSDRDPFLNPVEYDEAALPVTPELLGRILISVAAKFKDKIPTDAELLHVWPQGYFERLRGQLEDAKPPL